MPVTLVRVQYMLLCGIYFVAKQIMPPITSAAAAARLGDVAQLSIAKIIPIVWLAATGAPKGRVQVGLLLSAVGDIALEVEPTGVLAQHGFVIGLVAFLCAQVVYMSAFFQVAPTASLCAGWAVAFASASVAVVAQLWEDLPVPLQWPVAVYAVAVAGMGYSATAAAAKTSSRGLTLAAVGAVSFLASDTIIAVNKFQFSGSLPFAKEVIMLTYFAAQFLIAQGTAIADAEVAEAAAAAAVQKKH